MGFEFHAEARLEFLEAMARYEAEVGGLGARFVAEFERCIRLLIEAPRIGAPIAARLRSFPVDDGFPFSIVYVLRGDLLLVVAVAHQSRTPGYWKHRVRR